MSKFLYKQDLFIVMPDEKDNFWIENNEILKLTS